MTDPLADLSPPTISDAPSPEFTERLLERVEAVEARAARSHERAQTHRSKATWHLAQLNLGIFTAPLDDASMEEFVDALEPINALAESLPGFVWRLTDDDGGPSSNVAVPGANDPLLASNLSVWTDLDALRNFMYRTDHASYLRRRNEWFERDREPMVVAWWIPAGTLPTLDDALRRLDVLRDSGASDQGFPLSRSIPPPPTDLPPNQSTTESEPPMSDQVFVPYLTVGDSRAALQFYAEVFGAEQSGELFEMDDGRIGHAEMTIGGHVFYMADEFTEMKLQAPSSSGSNSVSLVIHVDDCDAVYNHAVAAGAVGERPPANQHGFRSGWFVDPWGHRWSPTSSPV